MTREMILADLKQKEVILKWLVEKSIRSIDEIGKFMANYYTGKVRIMK
jgi:hypothetical protein